MKDADTFVQRPWGNYMKLYQERGVWVKRVEVLADNRLSLQKHDHRSEKWIIVSGEGLAVINDKEIRLREGNVLDVPLGAVHRIGNTTADKLVFIEVATGDYLGEDDIVRFQDDYQREGQS